MKKTILTVIITAVICITGTAYAVSAINANQVTYTDSNDNTTTVKDALDNVYNNLESKMVLNALGTPLYATSAGDAIQQRTTTLSLNKGKYMVIASKGLGWTNTDTNLPTYSTSNFNLGSGWENLSSTSGLSQITLLGKYWNRLLPSAKTDGYYTQYTQTIYIYYVEITGNSDTLSTYEVNSVGANFPEHVTLIAIPIN